MIRKEGAKYMDNTTLTVGSITYAIKARRLLLHEGIKARTVKLVTDESGGCVLVTLSGIITLVSESHQ